MPLYEYRCECEKEREVLLPSPEPQVCECGEVMQLRMSVCSFVTKPTGRGMALDSLNSKGGGFSAKSKHTAQKQDLAARGL